MDLLRFADDAALTPVSELRQAAKARAKETGEKLSGALDAIAQEKSYTRWDALIEGSWALYPAETEGNPNKHHHLLKIVRMARPLTIAIPVSSDDDAEDYHLSLSVNDWTENDHSRRFLTLSKIPEYGRLLTLSDEERARIASADTLQSHVRTLAEIALAAADSDMPRKIGNPAIDLDHRDIWQKEPPTPHDTLHLVAEIPGGKSSYEIMLGIAENRDQLLARIQPERIYGLYAFRIQQNGSLVARRAKFKSSDDAWAKLSDAAHMLAFMSWADVDYPRYGKPDHDAHRMAKSGLFDHYHVFQDRRSGASVVLNQPYRGHAGLHREGMLNLLEPGTITAEAPPFTSLHGTSLVLFHALTRQGADLERIVQGAVNAALTVQATKVATTDKIIRAPRKTGQGKRPTVQPLSPASDLRFDLKTIPVEEARFLESDLPSVEQLRTPYWRNKMKAFQGKEELSWDLQDQYHSTGITLDDVIKSIRACPLDSDIWGFLHLFDFSEVTKAECFRRGAIAGEIHLGRKLFEEEEGSFWGVLETRPYMRCMNLLYRSLVKMKRPGDALPIGRRILELCHNDNLGIRFSIEEVEAAASDTNLASQLAEIFEDADHDSALN